MHESASISGSLSIHLPVNSTGGGNLDRGRSVDRCVIFDIFDIPSRGEGGGIAGRDTKRRVKRDKLGRLARANFFFFFRSVEHRTLNSETEQVKDI